MGAAFFSNATYTETLKVVNSSGVLAEPFALAGMRDQFRFNYTTGALEQVPALSTQFITGLMVEVSRYAGLWQKGFAPYSSPGFKVSRKPTHGGLDFGRLMQEHRKVFQMS
jgi:hypothetical protein